MLIKLERKDLPNGKKRKLNEEERKLGRTKTKRKESKTRKMKISQSLPDLDSIETRKKWIFAFP